MRLFSPSSSRPWLYGTPSAAASVERRVYVPCFTVEIAELAVLRLDLGRVDLGMMREDVLPPLLLVEFLQMHKDYLLIL